MRAAWVGGVLAALAMVAACGGGGSTSPGTREITSAGVTRITAVSTVSQPSPACTGGGSPDLLIMAFQLPEEPTLRVRVADLILPISEGPSGGRVGPARVPFYVAADPFSLEALITYLRGRLAADGEGRTVFQLEGSAEVRAVTTIDHFVQQPAALVRLLASEVDPARSWLRVRANEALWDGDSLFVVVPWLPDEAEACWQNRPDAPEARPRLRLVLEPR